MWHLTLAQMRRSLGRLTAAGLAIDIGTAFVGATLVAGGVITRTSSMWVELVAGAKRTVPEITALASDPRFEAQ
ncbi:MAG: hypothetical protein H7269_09865, partial [Cellulomonas sp.]|nr:hypothetical protein [Cellulomonas sp.]